MTDQLRLDLGRGVSLRDESTKSVLSHNEEWADRASRVIDRLAGSGILFTAEDVAEEVGLPPHPNAMGAAILAASKANRIVWSGQVQKATRDARHCSILRVWRGK